MCGMMTIIGVTMMRLLSGTMVIKNTRPRKQRLRRSFYLSHGILIVWWIGESQKTRRSSGSKGWWLVSDNRFYGYLIRKSPSQGIFWPHPALGINKIGGFWTYGILDRWGHWSSFSDAINVWCCSERRSIHAGVCSWSLYETGDVWRGSVQRTIHPGVCLWPF